MKPERERKDEVEKIQPNDETIELASPNPIAFAFVGLFLLLVLYGFLA